MIRRYEFDPLLYRHMLPPCMCADPTFAADFLRHTKGRMSDIKISRITQVPVVVVAALRAGIEAEGTPIGYKPPLKPGVVEIVLVARQ